MVPRHRRRQFDRRPLRVRQPVPTNHLKYRFLDLLGLRSNQMLGLAARIAGSALPGAKPAPWSLHLIGRLLALEDRAGCLEGGFRSRSQAGMRQAPQEAASAPKLDVVGVYPVMPGLAAHLQARWFVPGAFAKAVRGPDDALGGAFFLVFNY
jgi:hypothetical protein